MEVPAPVNLSALSGILAKSKQVMSAVDTKAPIASNGSSSINESYDSYSAPMYNETDEREPIYENYTSTPAQTTEVYDYTEEQVMSSNLPQAIKESLLKNRIPRLSGPPPKFTTEELAKITGAQIKQPAQPRQQINETVSQSSKSDMITISRGQLQDMINESINTFFKQVYDKTLTEQTIKKTINLLIKEGKINVKKKQI
jgi:hypothetical protein